MEKRKGGTNPQQEPESLLFLLSLRFIAPLINLLVSLPIDRFWDYSEIVISLIPKAIYRED